MKAHLIIKLNAEAQAAPVPHWTDILADKAQAQTSLHPKADAVLKRYRLPVWVTSEYKASRDAWSPQERQSGLNRIYRLILQREGTIPKALIDELTLLPEVSYARIGQIGQADLPTAELAYMAARDEDAARRAIYLDQARPYTTGDPAITVGVLDTGVSLHHPELQQAMLPGYDFVDIIDGASQFIGDYLEYDAVPEDEVGHGTHVAGIIAAEGRAMPVGVAPRCKILPVRVLGAMQRGNRRVGAGLVDNINTAVKWAVDQGADVINMSLGIAHTGGGLPHEEVVQYARQKGVTLIAASGNDGAENLYYPGALPHVIAVGALDPQGAVASFSTFGRQVDLVAPGTDIYSTFLNDGYAYSTGTSHAAPFVTGAVALLKAYARRKGRRLADRQIKYLLKHSSDKVDRRFKHRKAGFGKLNVLDALRLLDFNLN